MASKRIFIVPQYHCDVVWRRPPAEQTRIRDRQFCSALETLRRRPEFRFEFDQAALVREFLAARPEWLAPMRRFVREGRLDVTGGEETIPDTNMVSGEGLIRNLLLGRLWFEETLGVRPVVANLDDAFGMSAQLPQMLSQFGYRWFRNARMPGLDAEKTRDGFYWEALDGSRIFSAPVHGGVELASHVCNLPVVYRPMDLARHTLERAYAFAAPVVHWQYSAEEDPVADEVVRLILARVRRPGADARFALAREALAEMERRCGRASVVAGEFNPTLAGTYVTRIGVKQAYREAEQAALAAESAAACAALRGAAYPGARLTDVWRALAFMQFHDALCGCHTTAVNRAILRAGRRATRTAQAVAARALRKLAPRAGRQPGVVLFNSLPWPRREPVALDLPAGVAPANARGAALPCERRDGRTLALVELPPMGCACVPLCRATVPAPVRRAGAAAGRPFTVGPYRVTPRHAGLAIVHRAWGRTLVDGRFPEIRFRLDDGTLWEERFGGPMFTEESGEQRLVEVSAGPVAVRLAWRGAVAGDPAADPGPVAWEAVRNGKPVVFADLKRLAWEKQLVFYRDSDRIDARVTFDLRGRNTEVLVAFPLRLDLARARGLYEVPCAVVERKPYFEVPSGSPEPRDPARRPDGRGTWPALNWVAYADRQWGLALANRGTPAHRLLSGAIEVAVLRSPTQMASAFNVPEDARDNGRHTFEFALQPFRGDPRDGAAFRLGAAFNAAPVVRRAPAPEGGAPAGSFMELDAPGVAFGAWKRAERQPGFILRTHECRGRAATGRLRLGFRPARVREVDLMEQPVKAADPARLRWRPYEIKTLLIEVEQT